MEHLGVHEADGSWKKWTLKMVANQLPFTIHKYINSFNKCLLGSADKRKNKIDA